MKPVRSLLSRLPPALRHRVLTHCTPLPLLLGDSLAIAGTPAHHIYFLKSGAVSLVTRLNDENGLQVALAGRESMVGAQLAIGQRRSTLDATVVGSGDAHSMEAATFVQLLGREVELRELLYPTLGRLFEQLALSTVCNQHHTLAPRFARMLLQLADCARDDSFPITHKTLSILLGVRREGISLQAAAMKRKGLIAYQRGQVTIRDRVRLQALACACYAINRNHAA